MTIADCTVGEIINIIHGRFIVKSIQDVEDVFGVANKLVTLRRVNSDDAPIAGNDAVLQFQGKDNQVLR